MPLAGTMKESIAMSPNAVGPQMLVVNPQGMTTVPATIAQGASYLSGVIQADGWKAISVGAKTTLAGTITIQRYLDAAGTIPVGAAVTATITANTAQWATVNDGVAFVSFQVTVANTGAGVSTVTNLAIVLGAS